MRKIILRLHDFTRTLTDIFSIACHSKHTHEDMTEEIKSMILDHTDFTRLTQYERGYFHGFWQAKRDALWGKMWWLVSVDGELMTKIEVNALVAVEKDEGLDKEPEYRSPWHRVNSDLSRHVWPDDQGNPLRDKPFDRRFLEKK